MKLKVAITYLLCMCACITWSIVVLATRHREGVGDGASGVREKKDTLLSPYTYTERIQAIECLCCEAQHMEAGGSFLPRQTCHISLVEKCGQTWVR